MEEIKTIHSFIHFVLKNIKRRWRGRRVCLYPPRPTPSKFVCVTRKRKTEIGLNVPAFYFVFGDLLIPKMYVYMYMFMCLCAIFSCASMENGQKQSCVRYQLIYYFRKYDAIACNTCMSKIYCYAIYKVTKFLILTITFFNLI